MAVRIPPCVDDEPWVEDEADPVAVFLLLLLLLSMLLSLLCMLLLSSTVVPAEDDDSVDVSSGPAGAADNSAPTSACCIPLVRSAAASTPTSPSSCSVFPPSRIAADDESLADDLRRLSAVSLPSREEMASAMVLGSASAPPAASRTRLEVADKNLPTRDPMWVDCSCNGADARRMFVSRFDMLNQDIQCVPVGCVAVMAIVGAAAG